MIAKRLLARGPIGLAWVLILCAAAAGGNETHVEQVRWDGSCWPSAPGSDPRLCPPNDPNYPKRWEFRSDIPEGIDRTKMHPRELELGSIGFSLDAAWQQGIGRDDVVIAVLDSGIRWNYPDLIRKLYLNPGELPLPQGARQHDGNGDGIFNVEDYAGDPRVTDRNGNGVMDPGDLILTFSDCRDDDANGYADDISGYDFFAGTHCGSAGADNDPGDETQFGHGTGIAAAAAAETNNGIADAGVCPRCRVLPVRVGDSFVVDANQFARGLIFAVRSGASVVASALGSYNNTPAARFAVDFAYQRGVPIIASAADEFSYHHNYPSAYNHALYVNAIRFNHARDYTKASTFWGVNPCTNYGARVWITVPAVSCSSGATARLAGVAGLVQSAARDAGLADFHAEEVYQILRWTADDLDNSSPDWGRLRWVAKAGFDQYYGYGRLNARAAVSAVASKRIPPQVDLTSPEWFALVSPQRQPRLTVRGRIHVPRAQGATYHLDYALGVEPREEDYQTIATGSVDRTKEGVLGVLDFTALPLPSGPSPSNREERDRYSVTLRLRAEDRNGLASEARRSLFVFNDPSSMEHFPVQLGASGEASPLLVDLDHDGRDEIVLPTADGYLRILSWGRGGIRTVRAALDPGPVLDPAGQFPRGEEQELSRESVIRGAAVGDISGQGTAAIVVASREGHVYAFSGRGERLNGFPVAVLPELRGPATPAQVIESGILSRPVLAELDGKPGLEIVVTALDGHVYVWRGDGTMLPGFPVALEVAGEPPGHRAKIISTPAVGDVDGDGKPEIITGSNRLRGEVAAAYAVRARGLLDPRGPFLPGWQPFSIAGLRPGLLPTLARGVQMDPILVDIDGDGDREVLLYAVTGSEILLIDQAVDGPRTVRKYLLSPRPPSEFSQMSFLGETGSPLLADTDGDGEPELYAPLLPFRMLTLRSKPGVPLDVPLVLGGWRIGRGVGDLDVPMLAGYPRRMEDLMIFAGPSAADVDADGEQEVLMGSGGYLLHAFKRTGGEAAGFPKFTGGWIFSTPAVGDLDGDGSGELVTVTREGYLFAWRFGAAAGTPAPTTASSSMIR